MKENTKAVIGRMKIGMLSLKFFNIKNKDEMIVKGRIRPHPLLFWGRGYDSQRVEMGRALRGNWIHLNVTSFHDFCSPDILLTSGIWALIKEYRFKEYEWTFYKLSSSNKFLYVVLIRGGSWTSY